MKKANRFLTVLLTAALLLGSCGQSPAVSDDTSAGSQADSSQPESQTAGSAEGTSAAETPAAVIDVTDLFSDRDFETGYDESKSARIILDGGTASCGSDAVQISGSTVTITDEGTYILSGTLNDGMIIVNADENDKVQLVLDGVSVHSETSAPLYILQADKVFVTTAPDSSNTLSSGDSFTAIDENNIDAAVFSKEDLTLNGSGTLTVTSPAGHGIVSKDSLTITGGSYLISSASHGLDGKDDVSIADGTFSITAGKDGIHAENDDDASLGLICILNGSFDISAEGDGISAGSSLQIQDGSFDILSGGGSVNAAAKTSDSWGFMGGRGGHGGKGGFGNTSSIVTAEEDSTSIKGIKSSGDLSISGGNFQIDSADDAVHSNASVTVSGGSFDIASGDDGFHADEALTVTSGEICITESYEGIEGLHVSVTGGDITLTASDDGINAAGGTDSSGFGGMRGGDKFGGMNSGSSNGSITLSGGNIYIKASGDGIDANGTLEITGGSIIVCGPTQGDTATLDYDSSGTITGGTFIGTGSSMMAQSFSDAGQGVIAVRGSEQPAGTEITLTDDAGSVLLSHSPELSFAVVILSSPDIVSGETYTLTIGTSSSEVTAK